MKAIGCARKIGAWIMVVACMAFVTAPSVLAAIVAVDYPTSGVTRPLDIVMGSDGNLWYTESETGLQMVGRIEPDGTNPTEFPLTGGTGGPGGDPVSIALGFDGNVWVTEAFFAKIAKITPTGDVTHYPVSGFNQRPHDITRGPDGKMWFTKNMARISSIAMDGTVQQFDKLTPGVPQQIAAGPDGNLWFTVPDTNQIGRIQPDGTYLPEFTVPTSNSTPFGITAGPDGNMWFTERTGNKIGKVSMSGQFLGEYPIPTPASQPYSITAGPDGNLWFTENSGNKIGMITTAGQITEYPIPTSDPEPTGITVGPNNTIWFTEVQTSKVGQVMGLTIPSPPPTPGQDGPGGPNLTAGAPNTGLQPKSMGLYLALLLFGATGSGLFIGQLIKKHIKRASPK